MPKAKLSLFNKTGGIESSHKITDYLNELIPTCFKAYHTRRADRSFSKVCYNRMLPTETISSKFDSL